MTLIQGVHASHKKYHVSIAAHGLRPKQPSVDGNYANSVWCRPLRDQPRGVYFMLTTDWCGSDKTDDTWVLVYCGPLMHDPLIEEALVALQEVPCSWLTSLT